MVSVSYLLCLRVKREGVQGNGSIALGAACVLVDYDGGTLGLEVVACVEINHCLLCQVQLDLTALVLLLKLHENVCKCR